MAYIGIDTETANSYVMEDGKVILKDSLVYDVGWKVMTNKGKTIFNRSYIVSEIFNDPDMMASAYYADKIPKYLEDIQSGKRKVKSILTIYKKFRFDCKRYKVKAIFAHNALFDYRALNNTLRFLTGSEIRYFYPYGIELWDTLKMSREAIGRTKEYTAFCDENGFKTKHKKPRNRLTAEILYRYISGNVDFEESHTGLEDVEIETQIMFFCLKQDKEVKRRLFEDRKYHSKKTKTGLTKPSTL